MTLKGSNLHTKNASTLSHNPKGVEFQEKTINKTNLRLRRTNSYQLAH